MVKIIIDIPPRTIAELDEIARKGLASGGHQHDFRFVLVKAINEFVKKYEEK